MTADVTLSVEPIEEHQESSAFVTGRTTTRVHGETLRDSVERAMNNYFNNLQDEEAYDVYDLVLSEVEVPLLETVMRHVRNNQTKASILLGLNRGTLRKKLKRYGLL